MSMIYLNLSLDQIATVADEEALLPLKNSAPEWRTKARRADVQLASQKSMYVRKWINKQTIARNNSEIPRKANTFWV